MRLTRRYLRRLLRPIQSLPFSSTSHDCLQFSFICSSSKVMSSMFVRLNVIAWSMRVVAWCSNRLVRPRLANASSLAMFAHSNRTHRRLYAKSSVASRSSKVCRSICCCSR